VVAGLEDFGERSVLGSVAGLDFSGFLVSFVSETWLIEVGDGFEDRGRFAGGGWSLLISEAIEARLDEAAGALGIRSNGACKSDVVPALVDFLFREVLSVSESVSSIISRGRWCCRKARWGGASVLRNFC
jgi:hypothetical protein